MTYPAEYRYPTPLPEADVYAAVQEFLVWAILPPEDAVVIIQGWPDQVIPPPDTSAYAVINITADIKQGTNVEEYDDNDYLIIRSLSEVLVQIDFYAEDDRSRLWARNLAILARSDLAVRFFSARGISSCHAEDPRAVPPAEGAQQPSHHYMTTLHLAVQAGLAFTFECFQSAAARIENVDVHHPLLEE